MQEKKENAEKYASLNKSISLWSFMRRRLIIEKTGSKRRDSLIIVGSR